MNLNTTKFLILLGLTAIIIFVNSSKTEAQTTIKIGEAELVIQSPIAVKKGDDITQSNMTYKNVHVNKKGRTKFWPRSSSFVYAGVGLATPIERDEELPLYYGESYNIEAGFKNIHRLSRFYAIGTMFNYSFYNYKLKEMPFEGIFEVPSDNIKSEYFRTDNVGVGLFNRFYLTGIGRPRIGIDAGAYGDFAFSRRYKIKGDERKEKFHDNSVFNSLQAGLYGAFVLGDIAFYVKYRLTNQFNPDLLIKETPKLSIGLHWEMM